jgi:hypothetical protein
MHDSNHILNARRRMWRVMAGALLAVPTLTAVACAPASGDGTLTASEAESRWGQGTSSTTTTTAPTSTTVAPTTESDPDSDAVPASPPAGSYVTPGSRMPIAGCELFPRDNVFRATVTSLPVRPESGGILDAIGGSRVKVRAGFSAGVWEGSRGGYPINIVDARTVPRFDYTIRNTGGYPYMSDPQGHPLPPNPRFEGWPGMAWDRHLLVLDTATCQTFEAFNVSPPWDNPLGLWFADSAVKLDLGTNEPRSAGTAVASRFSMMHGLVRFDEVAAGDVGHVLELTLPEIRSGAVWWPAQASDGVSTNPSSPPMGAWFRLKPGVDLSGLGPQASVIARGLQRYGAVLKDTGGPFHLSGEPDVRWDDADLKTLQLLSVADFEVVDPSPMMISRTSFQIR